MRQRRLRRPPQQRSEAPVDSFLPHLPDVASVDMRRSEELGVSVGYFAAGDLAFDQRERLFWKTVVAILASFNVLVFLEGEKKFSAHEIVLITCRQPDARRHLRLLERKNSASI